jgi:LPXTG-motif cell wall-anchored protein
MKRVKNLMAVIASLVLSIPFVTSAQDGGTYIDSLNVQDSSYMQPLATTTEQSSSSSTTIIIIAAIAVVAVVAFLIIKKKKK